MPPGPLRAPGLEAVTWSALALDVASGEELLRQDADEVVSTASLAKVFLLVEVAARLADGTLAPERRVGRGAAGPVADSGLWQHLAAPDLALVDAAALVGAVSDNLATNVLLDELGLPAVQARAGQLAPYGSTLLDRVRDVRGVGDVPMLSRGCAADWAPIAARLARGEVVDAGVSAQVVRWLTAGVDLSMVAGGLGLDPLAHGPDDGPLWLWSKTGTSPGVRADVGVATGGRRAVAWAVLASWADTGQGLERPVLAAMREVGERLGERVRRGSGGDR